MAGVAATAAEASFAAFVRRHRAELVRAAGRIAVDSAEAEDVVQESLAQIGRSLSISSNTAASRCRYALAALRKALSGPRHSAGPGKDMHHGNERRSSG